MRPTLADYMRDNALKMESAELAPVTEIVAPVTIPDGVEERSRDHLILLPSPGVASSVQVGIGEGDAFEPLTEEQIGVSTVDGDETTASAIVVRDRKLAGELRIRYSPVDVSMEDGDKPFVQLGTVVEPGSENKNPYPANAPTEEPAPQVTNQPTVDSDKGDLEDKAKIAENAVDQSVAPKVEVTVVEKAPETNNQDAGEVVDANDGNTGERKAEEAAKETELKGPKEEEETQDNAVNSNGEDPAQAAAEVEQEQKNDDAAASTENGNDEGSEENADVTEGENEEEEEEEGKDDLKQEGFQIVDENNEQEDELVQLSFQIEADLNVDSTGYVAEDADKKGFFARAWENLVKFINKVKAWLNDKVFSKLSRKKRQEAVDEAEKLAVAIKAAKDLKKESLDNLAKSYTAGIRDLKNYGVLMTQLSALATDAIAEADSLAKEGFMALNGNSGSVEKVDAVNTKFAEWQKKYNITTIFGDGESAEANCAALNKELRAAFQVETGGSLDAAKLKTTASEIQSVLVAYTEKLDRSGVGSTTPLKSTLAVSSAMNAGTTAEHARLLLKNISSSLAYVTGALTAAQIIESAMKRFVSAAVTALFQAGGDLKTEGFSQPVEIMAAPTDVAPIVIPAEKPFLPESLIVTRVTDEDQLVILREDKVRVRTNEAGLGEAIVVVDPALQGQIQANYEAVVSGELPVMESDEDPVVTLDVITDDRDGVEIRVAQMVDGDTEEAIPEELVELRAEGAIALEAHENCIKGLSSMAYMVDMANSIQFEGDVQAAELVMEGMLDSIKGAMTRLGNWLDKSMKYQKVWDINWNQSLAYVQKEIRNARSGTAKADVVKLNRVVRNLTINGAPVTDVRELQRQLAEIAKLGNDAKAHMVAVGNLYEDVRRLIAKHDNVNPDGAAILKEIPALVKKVNLRPWASLVKGERQVSEKSVERVPTSAPFLGDVVVAERQSLNDLTYANPDKALRAMLEKTYVGYRTDWELDRDLTSAEMKVLSPQDMEALLNSLRKAAEAWDMYSTIVATGKKMDAFYRSLWSLKQYDRDFLSAYGVIIAADQWAYHPVLDLRFDLAYPMQAVLRLISINCAVYK